MKKRVQFKIMTHPLFHYLSFVYPTFFPVFITVHNPVDKPAINYVTFH